MIKVWTDTAEAGLLDRFNNRGSTFLYLPDTLPARGGVRDYARATSLMDTRFGLPPIFEMNLPEGALRERLRLALQKPPGPLTSLICSASSDVHRWDASVYRPEGTAAGRCSLSVVD